MVHLSSPAAQFEPLTINVRNTLRLAPNQSICPSLEVDKKALIHMWSPTNPAAFQHQFGAKMSLRFLNKLPPVLARYVSVLSP